VGGESDQGDGTTRREVGTVKLKI